MDYEGTLKYLENFQRFGIRLGLANIRKLLKLVGNPEKRLKVIHIGGTNGKGSVGAFLFYILKEAGYKVGLYTSPHLIDFRERIRTTQGLISKRELTKLVTSFKPQAPSLKPSPTFFEMTTALALKYFADKRVDFAILEVGMGGRLDATNITRPLVSVITNVDFEHTEHLGKSLKKIAYEKCGIIKRGIPVVTAENKKEALEVIEETCRKRKARLYRVGKEILVQSPKSKVQSPNDWQTSKLANWQTLNVQGIYSRYGNLKTSLLGKHQLLNAACVLGAVELLRPRVKITKEQIRKGLAKTIWPGRLEVKRYTVHGKRLTVILDGAHNVTGVKALKEAIRGCLTYERLILILGILKDKDIKGIVAQLAPLASRIIITKPQTPRAVEPEEIAEIAKEYSDSIVIKEKVSQAIRQAIPYAKSGDIILITGSLYTVGEAIKAF
ncbi:bifunctional folylpolyglutamate synthase/dihydrofolate synthase [bacterium]|nr:bifunctional folylpolyglutamate synthase/dihydrofolate synthase [bacterium]